MGTDRAQKKLVRRRIEDESMKRASKECLKVDPGNSLIRAAGIAKKSNDKGHKEDLEPGVRGRRQDIADEQWEKE